MRFLQQTEHDLTTRDGVINFARDDIDSRVLRIVDRLPQAAPARLHATEIIHALGQLKVKLLQIADGYQLYEETKNDGKERVVDRLYKG